MHFESAQPDLPQSEGRTTGRHDGPVLYVTIAWILTLLVLVALGWSSWDSHRRLAEFTSRAVRIKDLQGRIAQIDEVLTMSARMAASTGEPRWEERYNEYAPQLDAAILEARSQVSELAGIEQTDAANQRLVELETKAFDLVRQGESDLAIDLLLGAEYADQKALYAQGMTDLTERLEARIAATRHAQLGRVVVQLVAIGIAIALLVIGWLVVLRMLHRWRQNLLAELQRRQKLESSVAESTQEVTTAAAQMAASAQVQERTVKDFRGANSRAAGAVHEIAATATSLTGMVAELNDLVGVTTRRATTGQEKLKILDDAVRKMGEATGTLSAKISAIKEAADKINLATKTMVKVVDQTDLLSVNSAVEAEKAGEHAPGFRVVSREIRRLADQTAEATLEIDSIVKGIHVSVSSGVREVDRFERQMSESLEEVTQLAQELGGIIVDIGGLSTKFGNVSEAVSEQSAGTVEIRASIQQLDGGAEQIQASASEFASVTRQLNGVVNALQAQVSSFAADGEQ